MFDGSLNHIRLDNGVISGTALENNGDIGFDDIRGDRCSADTYFFLCSTGSDDIYLQCFIFQVMERLQDRSSSDPAVEGFSYHQVMIFIIGEAHIR